MTTVTGILLLAIILAGGMVTFREEIFAFGTNLEDLGHVPLLEETEKAQVAMSAIGESDVPKGMGDEGSEAGRQEVEALTMTEVVGAGGATNVAAAAGRGAEGKVRNVRDGDAAGGSAEVGVGNAATAGMVDGPWDAAVGADVEGAREAAGGAAEEEKGGDEALGSAEEKGEGGDEPSRSTVAAAEVVEVAAPTAAGGGGGDDARLCTNTNQHCVAWKFDGQCESNPRFMARQCAKACDLCEGSEGYTKLYATAMGVHDLDLAAAVGVKLPKSTLWTMMTGKTAKHLGKGEKLSAKLVSRDAKQKQEEKEIRAKAKKSVDGKGGDGEKETRGNRKKKVGEGAKKG